VNHRETVLRPILLPLAAFSTTCGISLEKYMFRWAELYIYLFLRPFWPLSWKVSYPSYCHHKESITCSWYYLNRVLSCLYILPLSCDIHTLVFWRPHWPPS